LERAGNVLLPFLLLAAGSGSEPSHAARGRHSVRPVAYREPSLLGGERPVVLRGALPDAQSAPWAAIAVSPDAAPGAYDALARHLASHGCAALAVERVASEGAPAETWWRYSEALGAAVFQVRAEADAPESEYHGRLDRARLLLVADGEGAWAAARVAAQLTNLRGVVLIDPPEPGPALPWLARLHAPLVVIASASSSAGCAEAWFNAAATDEGRRWLVELRTSRPAGAAAAGSDGVLLRDLRALVTAFADAELNLSEGVAPDFADAARRGTIDRRVRGGSAALPIEPAADSAQR
jgi:hypothetical protein